MCMFYHKGNYTEEGAWPIASEKEGRCVVVEWDPCLCACSSVVPLGLSGQNPPQQPLATSPLPAQMRRTP